MKTIILTISIIAILATSAFAYYEWTPNGNLYDSSGRSNCYRTLNGIHCS